MRPITKDRPTHPLRLRKEAADSSGRILRRKIRNLAALQVSLPDRRKSGQRFDRSLILH
jgi:hypothetical protein